MFSSLNTVVSLLQGPRLELDEVRNFNHKIKKEKRVSAVASSIPACSLRVTLKTESCSRSRATSHVVQLYMDPGKFSPGGGKKKKKKTELTHAQWCLSTPIVSHGGKVWSVIIHVFIWENNKAVSLIIHKNSFLLLSPNCSTRFFGGGFEVDLSRRRVSDRKMGTSSDLWHTRETQEVVGGGGAEGRGGNYNQANSTLILPCILSLSLSVKSRVVPGCQNCRRIYTNFFSLIIDLIYFTIHSLGFRFYVNVTMIFFLFFFSF